MSMFDQIKGAMDGKHPVQLAITAIAALERIAGSLETLAEHSTRKHGDVGACIRCEEVGRLLCYEHGPEGLRNG